MHEWVWGSRGGLPIHCGDLHEPVSPWTDEFAAGGSSDLVTIDDRTSGMELMTLTDDASLQPAVAAEFAALADLLGFASDAQWDTPSLCEGWRVREVIAHMTMAARYSEEEFMAELRRCDFDFSRLSNQIARRDAELPTGKLVANLRDEVMQHWTPPGGGYHGALNHVVIHGLDVTVPLGVPRRSPDETIRVVLNDLTEGGVHTHFGINIQGHSFQATDLDWSYGSGPALHGAAEDLALRLCGRPIPDGRLKGTPL
ncbi:maleylpyruvate isomerase family mycothiol-dependent enzyme [Streptomyces sp. NPDC005708]|uniref:maleylpyruvate isomerase family mycothiol-dependent enzyme n=1 Tax=Streptomyces sp. NPDC005708 TaxID=3154564 RepID=UPI0033C91577